MLIKLIISNQNITPASVAHQIIHGGLLCSLKKRSSLGEVLHQREEYFRSARERIKPRRHKKWKIKRCIRVYSSVRRTLRVGLVPNYRGFHEGVSRGIPEGLGLLFDGYPEKSSRWELKIRKKPVRVGTDGTPELKVVHPQREDFSEWKDTLKENVGIPKREFNSFPQIWGFQPCKQTDPLQEYRKWLSLQGGYSPLLGVRALLLGESNSNLSNRKDYLKKRLSRLHRRNHEYNEFTNKITSLSGDYLVYHWGKKRKKMSYSLKRFYLFRKRRIRNYLIHRVTIKNYLKGITRSTFWRLHPNRWSRLEKAVTLGGSYFEARGNWSVFLRNYQIESPLEYNLYDPIRGFPRLQKRRRYGARRWKLAQHPSLGRPHLDLRQQRWSWFNETPLGSLIRELYLSQKKEYSTLEDDFKKSTQKVDPTPSDGSLACSLFWSVYPWGRSRWLNKPISGRSRWRWLFSVKEPTTVEYLPTHRDSPKTGVGLSGLISPQWGRVSSSGTGMFLSLVTEHELRSNITVENNNEKEILFLEQTKKTPIQRSIIKKVLQKLSRISKFALYFVWNQIFWVVLSIFTPFWWVYSKTAQFWCWLWWFILYYIVYPSVYLIKALGVFMAEFFYRQTFSYLPYYVEHLVRDNSLVRAVWWVNTSWTWVDSGAEDDQSQIEITTVGELEDVDQFGYFEELSENEENNSHDLIESNLSGATQGFEYPDELAGFWDLHFDEYYEDAWDQVEFFLEEELPFWAGFFLAPWIDLLVRLPIWSFLESFSLWGVTLKLEFQKKWIKLLHVGGNFKTGRWWKIPLIFVRHGIILCLWLWVTYFVGTQLSYCTLRSDVLECGIPWREEYYLFWWVLVFTGTTLFFAPRGIKYFVLHELGVQNFLGIFMGSVEVTPPEEYQLTRPLGVLTKEGYKLVGLPLAKNRSHDNDPWPLDQEDRSGYGSFSSATAYDEKRLIISKSRQGPNSISTEYSEYDQENYFVLPIHRTHTEDKWRSMLWRKHHDATERSVREPHVLRTNLYEVWFERSPQSSGYGLVLTPPYDQEEEQLTHTEGHTYNHIHYGSEEPFNQE